MQTERSDRRAGAGERGSALSAFEKAAPARFRLRLLAYAVALVCAWAWIAGAVRAAEPDEKAIAEAKKLKNPFPSNKASLAQGKSLYLRTCQQCHGPDGKGGVNPEVKASDLTQRKGWKRGHTDGEIFIAIRDGTGEEMTPFKGKLNDQQIWHVVNFVKSLAPSKGAGPAEADAESDSTPADEAAPADPKKMKNPIAYSRASLKEGKTLYLQNCQICHDDDGKSLSNIDFEATDLTDPKRWIYGITPGETFVTLHDGQGFDMPPFKDKLTDEQIWHIVNHLIGIGPKDRQPELVEEP